MKLRYYQQLAIDQFNDHYYNKSNTRGILSMCCGSGKTLTFWSIIKNCMANHDEKIFMYVTSRRLLVNDVITTIINNIYHDNIHDLDIIYKVSDFSKNKLEDELLRINNGDNKFKYHFFEHYKKHCFIRPDDNKIINEIKSRLITKKILIITTYDSCDKFIESMSNHNSDPNNEPINPNLIILDESHNIVSVDKTKRANSILEINDNKCFYPHKYLFMTATPLKIIKKNINSEYHNDIIEYSMDNISVYGDIFFEYSFNQGKIDGYVSDFEVILPQNIATETSKEKYTEIIKRSQNLTKDEKQHLYFETIGELLNLAINKYNLKRTIVYLSQQAKIDIFENILKRLNIDCYICHSNQSNSDRNNSINEFKKNTDDGRVLLSVDILNEGIDIPNCDSIMFAEDRNSETVIVQNIGRCLRYYPNKTKAYVIIPTYVYNMDDTEITVFSSKFKKIRHICDIIRNKNTQIYNRITGVVRNVNYNNNDDDNDSIETSDIVNIYEGDWTTIDNNNEITELKNMLIENTVLISTDKTISNMTYDKFKKIVQKNKIKNLSELGIFINKYNIPIDKPHIHFAHESKWICYSDLFSLDIFTYDEAKEFIETHLKYQFDNPKEFLKYYNNLILMGLNDNGNIQYNMINEMIKIPNKPNKYYLSEWDSFETDLLAWNDFLKKDFDLKISTIKSSETNADKNLSNLINSDHHKKINKYIPLQKTLYDNYLTDLCEIIKYVENKFKPLKCKIGKIEYVADKNKKINSLFIKIRVLTNDSLAIIADYPIIINNMCKMSYDPILNDEISFLNKSKSGLQFNRTKSEYIKNVDIVIRQLINEMSEQIILTDKL